MYLLLSASSANDGGRPEQVVGHHGEAAEDAEEGSTGSPHGQEDYQGRDAQLLHVRSVYMQMLR